MKKELVQTLTDTFEGHAQQTETGVEFWLARDVQHLLGYSKWENFLNVISRAKTACEVSGPDIDNHFPDVRKMVDLGSGSQRDIDGAKPRGYWCRIKQREKISGIQLSTTCRQLKRPSPDGNANHITPARPI